MANFKRKLSRRRLPAHKPIPNTYAEVPAGFTEDQATMADLKAVGFHGGGDLGEARPGDPPLSEMLVEGRQMVEPDTAALLLRHAKLKVLRDTQGRIVATWDEGRWWTPEESDEFSRRILAGEA